MTNPNLSTLKVGSYAHNEIKKLLSKNTFSAPEYSSAPTGVGNSLDSDFLLSMSDNDFVGWVNFNKETHLYVNRLSEDIQLRELVHALNSFELPHVQNIITNQLKGSLDEVEVLFDQLKLKVIKEFNNEEACGLYELAQYAVDHFATQVLERFTQPNGLSEFFTFSTLGRPSALNMSESFNQFKTSNAYTPGVFILVNSPAGLDSTVFDRCLEVVYLRSKNLLNPGHTSSLVYLDARSIPVGLFDGLNVHFVPTTDVVTAAESINELIHEHANKAGLLVPLICTEEDHNANGIYDINDLILAGVKPFEEIESLIS